MRLPALPVLCRLAAAAALTVFAGCTAVPDGDKPAAGSKSTEQNAAIQSLPGWAGDRFDGWLTAFRRSCDGKPWTRQGGVDPAAWQNACDAAAAADTVDAAWIARHFTVGSVADDALVTGYFEPAVAGSHQPVEAYPVALYRPPPAASPLRRLPRAAVDAGGLAGEGLELLWLADPVDAFFLHIQGSGQVRLPNGSTQRIGYAGDNGQPYHAIGRDLVSAGHISRDAVSMQSIAAWLREHPAEAQALMQRNPRYIFFRMLDGAGPVGAQGVVLQPERSLAVDPEHIPYGLPVWLDLDHPDREAERRLQRLTVAQDTGSAIKGPARADFFWGAGERAADLAGRMKSRGRLYVLLPRRAAPQ